MILRDNWKGAKFTYDRQAGKLTIEVDMQKYRDCQLTADMSTVNGNSYRIAGSPVGQAVLDGLAQGLRVKLDVYVTKEKYHEYVQAKKQREQAKKAYEELQKHKSALEALKSLGINTDIMQDVLSETLLRQRKLEEGAQ